MTPYKPFLIDLGVNFCDLLPAQLSINLTSGSGMKFGYFFSANDKQFADWTRDDAKMLRYLDTQQVLATNACMLTVR